MIRDLSRREISLYEEGTRRLYRVHVVLADATNATRTAANFAKALRVSLIISARFPRNESPRERLQFQCKLRGFNLCAESTGSSVSDIRSGCLANYIVFLIDVSKVRRAAFKGAPALCKCPRLRWRTYVRSTARRIM